MLLLQAGYASAQTAGPGLDPVRAAGGRYEAAAAINPAAEAQASGSAHNQATRWREGGAVAVQPRSAAANASFDFDTGTPALTTGLSTPFDQISGGITAHFSATPTGAFSVQTDGTNGWTLSQFSGKYLRANQSTGSQVLAIKFNQNLTSISLVFATADNNQAEVPTTIQLTAYMDSSATTPVGTVTTHGTYASDTFPQGTLSYNAGAKSFNLVVLSIPYQPLGVSAYNVDKIVVTPTPVAFSNASAASLVSGAPLAAGSIVYATGQGLASFRQSVPSHPLPTTLAKTTVNVTDSLSAVWAAQLYYVSPSQINYVLPDGMATGAATVTVASGGQTTASGAVTIAAVAPGLFTANADGKGVPAANAITIPPSGPRKTRTVALCGAAAGSCVPAPIDLGPGGTQVVLELFGTGIRRFSSLATVSVKLGNVDAQVQSAGPVPQYAGLDQVNVLIPRTLAGLGAMDLTLTVDGIAANTVRINIK